MLILYIKIFTDSQKNLSIPTIYSGALCTNTRPFQVSLVIVGGEEQLLIDILCVSHCLSNMKGGGYISNRLIHSRPWCVNCRTCSFKHRFIANAEMKANKDYICTSRITTRRARQSEVARMQEAERKSYVKVLQKLLISLNDYPQTWIKVLKAQKLKVQRFEKVPDFGEVFFLRIVNWLKCAKAKHAQ